MATLLSFVRPQPLGWSNDEKAQFARIQKLLGDAGVMVEVEHGLTDEDEPWCVFCSGSSGEVIVHAARIDGHYIFDSAALPNTIRGRSLDDCAQRFVDDATVLARQPQRGSKILMHPSALLAGVMLTIFLYLETVGESSAHDRVILELDAEIEDGAQAKGDAVPVEDADTVDESPLLVLKQMLHQITEAAQKQESDRTGGGHGHFTAQNWGTVMLPAVVAAIAYAQDSMAAYAIDDGTPAVTTEAEGETSSGAVLSDIAQDVQVDPETIGNAEIVIEEDDVVLTDAALADALLVVETSTAPFEVQGGYVEPTALPDAAFEDIELTERSTATASYDTETDQEELQGASTEEPIALAQVSGDFSAASNLVRFIYDSSIELQDEIFALSDFVEVIGAEDPAIGQDVLEDLDAVPNKTLPPAQDDSLTFLPFEPVVDTVSSRVIADQITEFVKVTGLLRYDIFDRTHLTIYDESVIGLEDSADVTFRSFALHDNSTVTFIGFDHELDMVFA